MTATPALGEPGPRLFDVPSRPQWLALHDEPALLPGLPIIDAHHHLWEREHERYLLEELQADLGDGHRIVATVHVQCGSHYREDGPARLAPVGETEFASAIARRSQAMEGATHACAGIVGYADLRDERVDEVLAAHIAADPQRFKGIRQATAWDADRRLVNPLMQTTEGLYRDPAFRRGFARLAPRGLSFDAWALHPQLPEVVELARAFTDTTIVVDHIGAPVGEGRFAGRRDEVRAQWLQGIAALAACPNVVMKLGGLGLPILGMGLGNGARPLDSRQLANAMRPWLEPCIEHFGAQRCMFESNFPVDRASYRYRIGWNAFKRIAQGCPAHELAQLFHDTAARVYRLAAPAPASTATKGSTHATP